MYIFIVYSDWTCAYINSNKIKISKRFYVSLTVHLSIILEINQLNAQIIVL